MNVANPKTTVSAEENRKGNPMDTQKKEEQTKKSKKNKKSKKKTDMSKESMKEEDIVEIQNLMKDSQEIMMKLNKNYENINILLGKLKK